MNNDNDQDKPRTALIKDHLRRSFEDKATEVLPDDLLLLIEKLREQDDTTKK